MWATTNQFTWLNISEGFKLQVWNIIRCKKPHSYLYHLSLKISVTGNKHRKYVLKEKINSDISLACLAQDVPTSAFSASYKMSDIFIRKKQPCKMSTKFNFRLSTSKLRKSIWRFLSNFVRTDRFSERRLHALRMHNAGRYYLWSWAFVFSCC